MKRCLVMMVLLAVLMSPMAYAVQFDDVLGEDCERAVDLLSSLGIMEGREGGLFEPGESLTKAEMTTIIVRLIGAEGIGATADLFDDVPLTHWANANIATAYYSGIVAGVGERTFQPDEPITYQQAVKMIVCALGYDEVQLAGLGGYPNGYLTKASQLGILKGADAGGAVSRGAVAILLASAIDVDTVARIGYGDSLEYNVEKGVTLLSKYLDIHKHTGVITGSYLAVLKGERDFLKGQISFDIGYNESGDDELLFKTGTTNAEQLVGREVVLYAKSRDVFDATILHIEAASYSETLVIDAGDINADKSTGSTIYYTANSREVSASLSSGAITVYNGNPSAGLILPADGTLTLIGSGRQNYDVALTENYINLVVDKKNVNDHKLYFKAAPTGYGEMVIEPDERGVAFINADGSDARVADCSEWDILSVERSLNDKVVKIIRSSRSITGEATETDGSIAVIGGHVEYTIAKSLSGNSELAQVKTGLTARFRLDFMGRIAAVQADVLAGKQYGYLVTGDVSERLDRAAQLMIFTQGGKLSVFEVADSVKLTNNLVTERIREEKILTPLNGIADETGEVVSQLIRFETNDDGEINTIEISADVYGLGLTAADREKYFTLQERVPEGENVMYYGYDYSTFRSRYYLGSNTLIMRVPLEFNVNEKYYKIIDRTELVHAQNYQNLSFYDLGAKGNEVGVVLMRENNTNTVVPNDAPIGIVHRVSQAVNEDGETVTRLNVRTKKGEDVFLDGDDSAVDVQLGVENTKDFSGNWMYGYGRYLTITDPSTETEAFNGDVNATIPMSGLNPGDVIQYVANDLNELQVAAVRLRAQTPINKEVTLSSGKPSWRESYVSYADVNFKYGKVKALSDTALVLDVQGNDEVEKWERVEPYEKASFYLFDKTTNKITTITVNDIFEDDDVFIYRKTAYPQMFVVYR